MKGHLTGWMARRPHVLQVAVMLLPLLLAGCGGDDSGSTEETWQPDIPGTGKILFLGRSSQTGADLFVSDGSVEGTSAIARIDATTFSSSPRPVVSNETYAFFAADTPDSGRELWVLEHATGAVRQVSDVVPGPGDGVHEWQVTLWRGQAYFTAEGGIWRSDGTVLGTQLVVPTDNTAFFLTAGETALFFMQYDDQHIWMSDGTPEGTAPLNHEFQPGELGYARPIPTGAGVLIRVGLQKDYWYVDTRSSAAWNLTQELENAPARFGQYLWTTNGRVYFLAAPVEEPAAPGHDVWEFDPDTGGVTRVLSLASVPTRYGNPFRVGDEVYFPVSLGSEVEIWRYDGISMQLADTIQADFATCALNCEQAVGFPAMTVETSDGNRLLWEVDVADMSYTELLNGQLDVGTSSWVAAREFAGDTYVVTRPGPLADFGQRYVLWRHALLGNVWQPLTGLDSPDGEDPSLTIPGWWIPFDGGVVSFIKDPVLGEELLVRKFQPESSTRIVDVNVWSPWPYGAYVIRADGGVGFFDYRDGSANDALWTTDGTATGTGVVDGGPYGATVVATSGRAYFEKSGNLWATTAPGSASQPLLSDDDFDGCACVARALAAAGGYVYFQRTDASVWRFDPESGNANLLLTVSGTVVDARAVGATLVLVYQEAGTSQLRVAVSDGTSGGTSDNPLGAGVDDIEISSAYAHQGHIHFLARKGGLWRLWKVGGTPRVVSEVAVTAWVARPNYRGYAGDAYFWFYPWQGPAGLWRAQDSAVEVLPDMGARISACEVGRPGLLVVTSPTGNNDTDGLYLKASRSASFRMVKSLYNGNWAQMMASGDLVYMTAQSEHGDELWVTDGTASGTHMVTDLFPGPDWGVRQLIMPL